MSFGDFMGLAAVMATIVSVFAIVGQMYKRRLQFLERKLEITLTASAEKAAQYAARSSEIENRVRVLERIATDGRGLDGASDSIALQIEALRQQEPERITTQ